MRAAYWLVQYAVMPEQSAPNKPVTTLSNSVHSGLREGVDVGVGVGIVDGSGSGTQSYKSFGRQTNTFSMPSSPKPG